MKWKFPRKCAEKPQAANPFVILWLCVLFGYSAVTQLLNSLIIIRLLSCSQYVILVIFVILLFNYENVLTYDTKVASNISANSGAKYSEWERINDILLGFVRSDIEYAFCYVWRAGMFFAIWERLIFTENLSSLKMLLPKS